MNRGKDAKKGDLLTAIRSCRIRISFSNILTPSTTDDLEGRLRYVLATGTNCRRWPNNRTDIEICPPFRSWLLSTKRPSRSKEFGMRRSRDRKFVGPLWASYFCTRTWSSSDLKQEISVRSDDNTSSDCLCACGDGGKPRAPAHNSHSIYDSSTSSKPSKCRA